jgi:hypothetical protein
MAIGFRQKSWIISFLDFFFLLFILTDMHLIFGTLLCNTKTRIKFELGSDPLIMTCRSGLMTVAIYQSLEELCLLRDCTVFRTLFFSLLTYIQLIFGSLLCHTKILIKFEFGSAPLIMTCRSSSKMVAIDQFIEELLRDFTVFRTISLSAYRYSINIWYIVLPY